MFSCYEDYVLDYDFDAVYFPYQIDVRTFVVGEGMKIEVGVDLGGVRFNTRDRNVGYILDGSLITPALLTRFKTASNAYIKDPAAPVTALIQMPSNYYTISNNSTMVIRKDQHMGSVVIRPDSAKFLADPASKYATYVLPFRIKSADADSIIAGKDYNVVALRYDHMLFGKYWHGGVAVVNRPSKSDTTIKYFTQVPMPEAKVWSMATNSPTSVIAPGYLDQVTNKPEMILTLNGADVTIGTTASSTYAFTADGASTFNRAKLLQDRKLFLKYKYTDPASGWTYRCTDTLTFRNRLRDGINEWQDENPANYK